MTGSAVSVTPTIRRRKTVRKLLILLSTGLLALGLAGSAGAAPLNWEGTWTLDMGDFGTGSTTGGGVATINASSGGVPAHLSTLRLAGSRGHVTGTWTNLITDPESAGNGLAALKFEEVQGGTGTWAPISGGAASTAALTRNQVPTYGFVKVCLLSTECTQFLGIPFTGPTTVNGVPGTGIKGIGIGGLLTLGGYGGVRMSLLQAPWTIKTATVVDQITTTGGSRIYTWLVYKGWAHAPASTTSSTAQPGGVIQLIAPQQVETNLQYGSNDQVGTAAIFVIRFIPEPGLLLLMGSGVAGLALLGRKRWRK
jgi:hypothetical protein